MAMKENLEIRWESNWDDYLVENKKTRQTFPVLCPVSDSRTNGDLDYSTRFACADVLNTRRSLLEVTRDVHDYDYTAGLFGDVYSVQQIIDIAYKNIKDIFQYGSQYGFTSDIHYKYLAKDVPHRILKDTTGCRLLRFNGYKTFSGEFEEISYDIENYGPIVGLFPCNLDFEKIKEDFLYISATPYEYLTYDDGSKKTHAVMIVGSGLAFQRSPKSKIPYYVFQNNWGEDGNRIGRIPASYIQEAYAPIFDKQCNLNDFLEKGGNKNYRFRGKQER